MESTTVSTTPNSAISASRLYTGVPWSPISFSSMKSMTLSSTSCVTRSPRKSMTASTQSPPSILSLMYSTNRSTFSSVNWPLTTSRILFLMESTTVSTTPNSAISASRLSGRGPADTQATRRARMHTTFILGVDCGK